MKVTIPPDAKVLTCMGGCNTLISQNEAVAVWKSYAEPIVIGDRIIKGVNITCCAECAAKEA